MPGRPVAHKDPDSLLKPQTRLVLKYLRSGRTLTTFIAINALGVASLSSRVAELRRLRYGVKDGWAKDFEGQRYKKYRLVDAQPRG
jgi:helix-turn-helix protein